MESFLKFAKRLDEDMVAGDSGGNPTDIAAGQTTGSVTNPGPELLTKKKKKPGLQTKPGEV